MHFLVTAFISAIGLLMAQTLFAGLSVSTVWAALAFGVVLGILNAFARPVLMFLTLPINLLTLGLFTIVINALILWLAAAVVAGVTVAGFWTALGAALFLSVLTSLSETAFE